MSTSEYASPSHCSFTHLCCCWFFSSVPARAVHISIRVQFRCSVQTEPKSPASQFYLVRQSGPLFHLYVTEYHIFAYCLKMLAPTPIQVEHKRKAQNGWDRESEREVEGVRERDRINCNRLWENKYNLFLQRWLQKTHCAIKSFWWLTIHNCYTCIVCVCVSACTWSVAQLPLYHSVPFHSHGWCCFHSYVSVRNGVLSGDNDSDIGNNNHQRYPWMSSQFWLVTIYRDMYIWIRGARGVCCAIYYACMCSRTGARVCVPLN